ncbi:MAG: rhodanese-like domain-containing protein [Sulfuritalea sp.]|nr:rhodanese-like domain-containing protein [Sulfuritalea sp.]
MRAALLALALLAAPAWAASDFAYTQKVGAGATVIDSRPLADCKRASLPGARCLPAGEFLDPQGRLPSERDILWLLGTAGLAGSEAALVIGQDATARDFVAGLLYLAGQKSVRILNGPLPRLAGGGQERGMVRSAVWTAPMRDDLWVLGADILRDKPTLVAAGGPALATANGVVVAADAYQAIARFTQLRAGQGVAVRVHPGSLALAAGSAR